MWNMCNFYSYSVSWLQHAARRSEMLSCGRRGTACSGDPRPGHWRRSGWPTSLTCRPRRADRVDGSRSRACVRHDAAAAGASTDQEPNPMQVITIGLDLAKSVFQVYVVAADGSVAVRRRLRRRDVPGFFAGLPPCLVGMEASRSAHYWARELTALGHTVRLMPPSYVKPYVKRNKHDATDAEAICEAVTRPTMRFVPVKSEQQQAAILLHRVRDLLIRQRTQLVNALRSHLAEFGIVGPQGLWNVKRLDDVARDGGALPAAARRALSLLVEQLESFGEQIAAIEKDIRAWHRQHEA